MIGDIQKIIDTNRGTVLEKSIINYGQVGLHSIALQVKGTDQYTRLMIATPDHELWKNHCGILGEWNDLSMAIHSRKNTTTIYPLHDYVWIINFEKERKKLTKVFPPYEFELNQYYWRNPLFFPNRNGFELQQSEVLTIKEKKYLITNDDYRIANNKLITIYAERHQLVAWVAVESQGEFIYDRLVYSNCDLQEWNSDGLYKKATAQEINDLLKKFNLSV